MKSGCQVVDQIGELEIVGNIVPHLWYKNITFSSGKAHFVAITLLADIVYWYRPTMIRDDSGLIRGARTKFKGDMLQKSYQAFADTYGFTKRQVKDAIDFLVEHQLLVREFRTISSSSIILSNVMFVQPVAENVKRVMGGRCHVSELVSICPPDTPERTTSPPSKEGLSHQEEWAPDVEEGTYTESTSKNPSENNEQQQSAYECPVTFFKENEFGRLGSYIQKKIKSWCESLSESLVVEAMKRAVEQGKHYWSYVDAILVKWEQLNVRDVKDAREKEIQNMFEKVYKKKSHNAGRRPIRTEKLPDWFTGEAVEVQGDDDEEFEAEKAKLMAELEAYRERGAGVVM
ncbi:DnaD domain-containing protein [Rossellomorea aquimaris]|uniref:DnaD/phage-associated family protein n=1 Tax=Rossellomorea aquimaris TaxID=189382 RepID=A0A366EJI9_9BACI|nr:DnaD domain protein [Rossellomorea aquimaris]RBP02494.1 DnaD/phage-associated family protein [Rossellomorea aquimaris]